MSSSYILSSRLRYLGKILVPTFHCEIGNSFSLSIHSKKSLHHFRHSRQPVRVNKDGSVKWTVHALIQTSCDILVHNYPFDTQVSAMGKLL